MPLETRILNDVKQAAALLKGGGVVAFPTETVYGLGGVATNEAAVARIFEAKGRPGDNPLIVHVADVESVAGLTPAMPDSAASILAKFAPGPVTVIVPRGDSIPAVVSAGLDTLAVRIPDHPIAQALLREVGLPIAAPSANRSGAPSATSWETVLADLEGRIDGVLLGGASRVGLESTVVDCTSGSPVVLRVGAISLEQLREVAPSVRTAGGRVEASPGTRHPHYAPLAEVRLVDSGEPDPGRGFIGLDHPGEGYGLRKLCGGVDAYAHHLYAFFRECDRRGLSGVDCQMVDESGLGAALMDRIRRAAAASRGAAR